VPAYMDKFKAKLVELKGALLKSSLLTGNNPGKMNGSNMTTKACEELDNMSKALSGAVASSMAKQLRLQSVVHEYNEAVFKAGVADEQPTFGTTRQQDMNEPPLVPTRKVTPEQSTAISASEVYKSCTGCKKMNKSTSASCTRCDSNQRASYEAPPFWKR
jgi:hypothetical protein